MNMQSRIATEHHDGGAIECAIDLIVVALEVVDYLPLPGDIGAHLDHALNLLRKASDTVAPPVSQLTA